VRRAGARIRDLEVILARGVFERVDDTLAKLEAQKLYQALTVSDQAQMREFYLSKVEEVDSALQQSFSSCIAITEGRKQRARYGEREI
jgi:hypothetical protein